MISLCKICYPWGWDILAQGHNLNKLGRGSLGDATYQISRLRLYGFRQEIFSMFSLYKPMSNMWPLGWGHFWPQGYNLNKLGRGPLGDATCQISRLLALRFQRRFFLVFSYISLCKTIDPRDGAIFGPRGIIWTNLVERSTRSCYIPNIKALRQEDFSMFPYICLCKTCDPWSGAIFGPRAIIWTYLVLQQQQNLGRRFGTSKMHLSPPVA